MRYFKSTEFMMGDEVVFDKMDPIFLEELDHIRALFCNPIMLTSSYRSEEYNKSIGGSKYSQHILGRAVDIKITSYSRENRLELLKILTNEGLTVGVAKTFWHIDNRDNQTIFGY